MCRSLSSKRRAGSRACSKPCSECTSRQLRHILVRLRVYISRTDIYSLQGVIEHGVSVCRKALPVSAQGRPCRARTGADRRRDRAGQLSGRGEDRIRRRFGDRAEQGMPCGQRECDGRTARRRALCSRRRLAAAGAGRVHTLYRASGRSRTHGADAGHRAVRRLLGGRTDGQFAQGAAARERLLHGGRL